MDVRSNIGLHLAKRAEIGPNLEAVFDVAENRRLTYSELNERADRLAEGLRSLGLNYGDRVGLLLPNSYRFMEVYYGAAKAGIIVVPLNTRLVADEVGYILRDSGATALISGESHADLVADLKSRTGDAAVPVSSWLTVGATEIESTIDYDDLLDSASGAQFDVQAGGSDPLFIMYTSGTTGRPKGTIQTHDTVEWSLFTVVAATDMRHRDRYLISMPLYHIAGFNNMGTTLYRGGVVVILQKFDAEETWTTLRDESINITLAVPAMLNAMLEAYDVERHQPLALRWILSGAQAIPPGLIRTYESMGFQVWQAYGLTEACGVGTVMAPEDAYDHVGSIGRSMFHTDLRVVDPLDNDCEDDVPGELIIRGKHVMAGYWKKPEATAEALRGGWLHTGDVAVRDADGFFYIRDRLKDMIISGGENIYPAEIETLLADHPQISDVSVIGVPSERWGESPLAIVVRADQELDEATVIEYCSGKLARFKIPKGVEFVDEIPRNATGKALKTVLREEFSHAIAK